MISFVIPAYNAEKTIINTVNSILNQKNTTLNYEIIVVNDGSSDKTDDIMQKFKENDKIKYFKKENSGVADTRNYGVNKAKGDYIIFVDSDDYISTNLLKDIEPYIKQKIELIKWSPIFVDEDKNELNKGDKVHFDKVTGEQGFNNLFGKDKLIDCLWNYAIKKDIMQEFPKGAYHEDFAVMPLIILTAKSMVSINKFEYYYVQSKNSIMRNNSNEKIRKKLQDKLNHFDNLIKQVDKMKLEDKTRVNFKIYITNALLVVLKDLNAENKKWFKKELKNRQVVSNIKVRNVKQLAKKAILFVTIH